MRKQARDLAERMKLFLLIFKHENVCFAGKKIRMKISKGGSESHDGNQYWCVLFASWNAFWIRVSGLEHLCCGFSCEGEEMFWSCFLTIHTLSAMLDRQGLLVAAPVHLRSKWTESLPNSYWSFFCQS